MLHVCSGTLTSGCYQNMGRRDAQSSPLGFSSYSFSLLHDHLVCFLFFHLLLLCIIPTRTYRLFLLRST